MAVSDGPMLYYTVLNNLAYLFYPWQKQQTHMQTLLKRLSQKQNVQSKETQEGAGQQLSNKPSEHSSVIQRFKEILAEKDAIIKELQKTQQFSDKVGSKRSGLFVLSQLPCFLRDYDMKSLTSHFSTCVYSR